MDNWKNIIDKNELSKCLEKLKECEVVIPRREVIFRCFEYFQPKNCKIVIVAQDPYNNINIANGLAFSCDRIQGSMKNIQKAIKNNGYKAEGTDLECWAKQDVLLLNRYLTRDRSKSHKFWKELTRDLLCNLINEKKKSNSPIIVMLWGNDARELIRWFPTYEFLYTLEWSHPSPLSILNNPKEPTRFELCTHFKKANDILKHHKLKRIDWSI